MYCTSPLIPLHRNLVPVTQLYVSVDASTKESLKKIDRPLFRDFWPRFISSLEALSEKVLAEYMNMAIVYVQYMSHRFC